MSGKLTSIQASQLGRKGGNARHEALSPERRSEIAAKAAQVRWAKEKKQ